MLKFELSSQMVEIIGKALDAQPHGLVRPVMDELQKQINAQQKPAVAAVRSEIQEAA